MRRPGLFSVYLAGWKHPFTVAGGIGPLLALLALSAAAAVVSTISWRTRPDGGCCDAEGAPRRPLRLRDDRREFARGHPAAGVTFCAVMKRGLSELESWVAAALTPVAVVVQDGALHLSAGNSLGSLTSGQFDGVIAARPGIDDRSPPASPRFLSHTVPQ